MESLINKAQGKTPKSIQDFISSVADSYVVRPTGDYPNKIGTGGFLFDILDQEEAVVEAEATDHYVEKNYAVQDHIAIRPIIFTLKGFVGELNDISIIGQTSILTKIQSLGDLGGLAPDLGQQAAQVYSKISSVTAKVNSVINQANNIFDIFRAKNTSATRAQEAFIFFSNLCTNRILCSVETPFGNKPFENMMVMRVSAINRGETKIISDFTVMFKQIRTVETITEINPKIFEGRASEMFSNSVPMGNIVGESADRSLLDIVTVER